MVPNTLVMKHRELSPCWIEGFMKLSVSIVIITTAEIIEREDMRMIMIFIWFGLSGVTDLLVFYEHEADKHANLKMLIVAFLMEAVFLQMKVSSASMKQYDLMDFLLEISICCVILCLIAGLIIKRLQVHIVTSCCVLVHGVWFAQVVYSEISLHNPLPGLHQEHSHQTMQNDHALPIPILVRFILLYASVLAVMLIAGFVITVKAKVKMGKADSGEETALVGLGMEEV